MAAALALRTQSLVGAAASAHPYAGEGEISKRIDSIGRQLDQLENKVSNDISTILSILQDSRAPDAHSTSAQQAQADPSQSGEVGTVQGQVYGHGHGMTAMQAPPHRSSSQPSDIAQVWKSLFDISS